MGAANVSVVYARWAGLPDGPFRILGQMALIALDGDEVPRYWGGRDLLAHALGYVDLPKRPTGAELDRAAAAQAVRERDRAFRAVARAVEQLTAAGVVERVSGGVNGHNAVYALQLLAERKTIKTATRKLGAGQRDAVKQQNRAAVRGDTACPPDDGERTTPGVTQEDTNCHPPRGTPGVLLRVTPGVVPGGHPVSPEKDTRCHPEEEEEERGKEEEQSAPEVISHLADAGAASDDGEMATSALAQSDERCPHDVRHGLTRNPAGRIRCPACRRSAAVPA